MTLTIGSLCTGYGGLDLAVESALGARTAWVSDIDKGACKVLAHRFPHAPNIGDMTAVDWAAVEPVDVITGGTPCQDLSHAGKRAGMTEGTRSNLWVAMREAIATIRPRLVIWENVGGAYSAAADSEMERREGRLGDRPGRPALRALGRVLGDLDTLGYVGGWHGLRAADVGAPHGRLRVFVIAVPADTTGDSWGLIDGDGDSTGDAERCGRLGNEGTSRRDLMLPSAVAMLPTPQARDWKGYGPADGDRHDPNLSAIPLLLPTPRVANNENRQSEGYGGKDGNFHGLVTGQTSWGQYAAAIARWESLTRPAPAPTETGPKGNPRLSPLFTEWMMGLPAGWITDVPGVTRNEALKLCGNGVVPQQAETAIRFLLPLIARAAA